MKSLIVLFVLICVSGCIEVRDKDEQESPEVSAYSNSQNMIVDQPVFVHEGRLLSERAYQSAIKVRPLSVLKQRFSFDYKQLTIKPEGVIYSMGHDVDFQIEDLYSEGGLIATFPKDIRAENSHGRSGGHLQIDVQSARGVLVVEMRGEHGAHALPARQPGPELDGKFLIQPRAMGPFSGVSIDARSTSGKRGYPGNNGSNGGNTGSLDLKIRQASNFFISHHGFVGEGGNLSIGGEGGRHGGRGERAGRGANGSAGKVGIREEMCIEVGSERRCS